MVGSSFTDEDDDDDTFDGKSLELALSLTIRIVNLMLSFAGFEMSDDQHGHAVAMERLVSSLASLRIEIFPEYMTENCLWNIYFAFAS